MKNLFILFFVLTSLSANAQFRNPGRGIRQSPQPNQNQPREYEFSPEKAIGITVYNIPKAAKKIGLKESKPEYQKFKNIIYRFNKDIKGLSRINTFTFSKIKQEVESAQKLSLEARDFTTFKNALRKASDTFKPIVDQVKEKEKSLDEKLKPILSKKQFKKWEKYKQRQKTKRSK